MNESSHEDFAVYDLPTVDLEGKVKVKPELKLCEYGISHFKPPDEIHLGSWVGGLPYVFEEMFIHEFLHYLLFHFIGLEASVKLDRIAEFLSVSDEEEARG